MQHGPDASLDTEPGPRPGSGGHTGRRRTTSLLGVLALLLPALPLALLVRAQWPPLVELDLAVSRAAQGWTAASALRLRAAEVVTLLGEPVPLTAAAAVLAVVLAVRGHRRLALYVVAVRVGSMVLSTGLKLVVDRARPVFDQPIAVASGLSFPSGHALGSAACFLGAAVLVQSRVRHPRRWLVVACILAVAVAASRVLLGVHFPSDVLAGLALGAGWVAVCTAAFHLSSSRDGREQRPRPPRPAEGTQW